MASGLSKLRRVETVNVALAPSARTFGEAPARPPAANGGGVAATFSGLTRRFGDKVVLDRIDLHIPAGQFIAIVGKSGCGKSTLLRQLSGLDQPSDGKVIIGGGDEARAAARIMFQEPRLLPWRRVLANVEVGLPSGVKGGEGRERSRTALAEVGLADRADEWPSVLSGGQKQRVALARALVSRPQILSLDEPLGALDALTRIEMQMLIERIWLEQGFTAVLVTHDVAEAVALADRVIVIDRGRIVLDVEASSSRPRQRGSAEGARLEAQILDRLFSI